MKNIILIGFMGSGKSSVGKKLAEKLGIDWLDMDTEISEKEGKSISEIFEEHNEDYFRDLETKYLYKIINIKNVVLSTGGGVVLKKENIDLLKNIGTVIFLHADSEQLMEQLKDSTDRPLLKGENVEDKIKSMLEQRDTIYVGAADIIIQTTGKTIENVVEEIISLL